MDGSKLFRSISGMLESYVNSSWGPLGIGLAPNRYNRFQTKNNNNRKERKKKQSNNERM